MDIQLRCHSACRWDSGQLGVEENCEEKCFVLVGLNFHIYVCLCENMGKPLRKTKKETPVNPPSDRNKEKKQHP